MANDSRLEAELLNRLRENALVPVGLVGAALVGLMVVVEGAGGTLQEGTAAARWAEQVGDLGLVSVYPPSEDIQVGDVMALVLDTRARASASGDVPARRWVRLGWIDVREEVLRDARRRPVSVGSDPAVFRLAYAAQADDAPAAAREIPLAQMALPALTRRASGSAGVQGWGVLAGLAGSGRASREEEIMLSSAFTYGMDAVTGAMKLTEWCYPDGAREPRCDPRFLRPIIRSSLREPALADDAPVAVMMVTGVVLAGRVTARTESMARLRVAGAAEAEGGAPPPAGLEGERMNSMRFDHTTGRPLVVAYRGFSIDVTERRAAP